MRCLSASLAALTAHPRRVREISVGPARFATAGRRRLTLLFACARFGRLVSGASTHRIAAAVTLVGACGVPDSTSRPANGGASDTDLPRLLRLEKPETRIVPSSDVSCRSTGTTSCSAPADWQLRLPYRPLRTRPCGRPFGNTARLTCIARTATYTPGKGRTAIDPRRLPPYSDTTNFRQQSSACACPGE